MTDSPRKVLITGANGFVGARLCHRFLKEGFKVVAGVRKTADLSNLKDLKLEYRYGDITDSSSLPAMVAGVDYVIHNAGLVKARQPDQFFKVNQTGTRNLCQAIKASDYFIQRTVLISSLAAMGPSHPGQSRSEDDPPVPLTIYGKSKLAGEQEALSFADDFPLTIVRPPGVYGPGDREIFDFFKSVHMGLKPVIGNPQRLLQLVHVDDLCRGIFLAATTEIKSGEAFFIAEQKAYTMEGLVGVLQEVCNKNGFPLRLPGSVFKALAIVSESIFKTFGATPMLTREKANELLAWWEVDIAKADKQLGFRSQISFEDGARQTYNWYLNQGWLK